MLTMAGDEEDWKLKCWRNEGTEEQNNEQKKTKISEEPSSRIQDERRRPRHRVSTSIKGLQNAINLGGV